MPDTLLRELFAKYLHERITPEEFSQLYDMMHAGYDPEALDGLLEDLYSNPAVAVSGDDDRKEVFASLLAKMKNSQAPTVPPARTRPLYHRRWLAAGVAAMLLLPAGSYWLLSRPHNAGVQPAVTKAVKFDAPPGHDGAVLTLADGKQVVLDTSCNGTLAQQGNAELLKQGAQLSYKLLGNGPAELSYNVMTTARGRQFQLVLSDGSKVWLNASSSIRFPAAFAGNERKVEITGEAYFEVTHDKSRPFIVQAGTSAIEVLGTHFDIADYNDDKNTSATLLEGSIKLRTPAQQLLLLPGEQGRVDRPTEKIAMGQVDTDEVIAWTRGRLAIGSTDFAGFMRQLSRWYDVDVAFEGAVPNLRIGGLIHRDVNLATVLDFLGKNGVHYKTEGKTITILP